MKRRDSKLRRSDIGADGWWPGDLKATAKPITGTGLIEPQPFFWYCNGAEFPRASRLFEEIGVDYGPGNGTTTANLPDYRGRGMMFALDGAIGANRVLALGARGAAGGSESVTLGLTQIPPHDHGGATGTPSANHTHSGTTGFDSPDHVHGDAGHAHVQHAQTVYEDVRQSRNVSGSNWDESAPAAGRTTGTGFASIGGASPRHQHPFASGTESATHTHPITAAGGGGSHTNVHPHQVAGAVLIRY